MSQEKLIIIFDINTLKLFQMKKFITDVEYIYIIHPKELDLIDLWATDEI